MKSTRSDRPLVGRSTPTWRLAFFAHLLRNSGREDVEQMRREIMSEWCRRAIRANTTPEKRRAQLARLAQRLVERWVDLELAGEHDKAADVKATADRIRLDVWRGGRR